MHHISRRKIGAVIAMKVPERMHLMLLVLGMSEMFIRFNQDPV